jgi:TRAP-type C4-dicarboxylate transport system substrate-binding protein
MKGRNNQMTKKLMKLSTIMLAVLLCVSLLLTACGGGGGSSKPAENNPPADSGSPSADDGKTYTLKYICSWTKGNINFDRLEVFKEEIERLSNGRLVIDIIGGSDVFPASETAEAVMNGVADGAYSSVGYFASYIPESEAISVSNMTFAEMVDSGGIDFLNEKFFHPNNLILYAVGNEVELTPFNIYMKTPVSSLADIQGKKVRTSPGFLNEVVAGLGATATPLALNEVFSALEQNLIDGFTAPSFIGGEQGFFEYAKYMIYPGILRPGGAMIINKNSFEALPEDLQKLLLDNAKGIVTAWDDRVDREATDNNIAVLKEKGGEVVELPAADAAKVNEISNEIGWEIIKQRTPEYFDELKAKFLK